MHTDDPRSPQQVVNSRDSIVRDSKYHTQNFKDKACKTVLRLLILDVWLSTSGAKPQSLDTVLFGLQKIGATAVLLVGPTRPHLAILDFLKCVQTVRTFAGKLSMVWPHDVPRVLRLSVRPNYINYHQNDICCCKAMSGKKSRTSLG